MPRAYVELADVLAHLPAAHVVFERRPRRYKFGALSYGEVPGWYNRADGDPWDVFAPGYRRPLPTGRPYRVAGVLGHLALENGNHKIAVRLDVPGYDGRRAAREIARYAAAYTQGTGVAGTWQPRPTARLGVVQ